MEATTVTPPELLARAAELLIRETPRELKDAPSSDPLQSQELPPTVAIPSLPPVVHSLRELKALSSAINAFNQCYEDLQTHLDSIRTAIHSKLNAEASNVTPQLISGGEVDNFTGEGKFPNLQQEEEKAPKSELESLCKFMLSRDIKKYMVNNLSNLRKLREEVPKALQLAPNPPKLVLECLGRFFLQGSKAYTKDSPMIPAREASVLMLECFLLMKGMSNYSNGELIIDKSVKEEAENVAVAWRKRLVTEGGLARANEIDARGLLLFVSCFGILGKLKKEDIRDLVVAGNAKDMLDLLQKSTELMNKIPEIVEWMIQNKMEPDAVNLVYTFGLLERFNPQTILTSYLRDSKASGKRIKKTAQGSAASVLEANKNQLAPLKSIVKCLEKHGIDPSKLLPGWQICQKISMFEKEIANFDLKQGDRTGIKRKPADIEPSKKMRNEESKRARLLNHGQPQNSIGLANSRRNIPANSLPSHVYNYSATPSIVYGGPGAGLMPENMLPPTVGKDIPTNRGGTLPFSSYAGVHGGMLVDSSGHVVNHGAQGGMMVDSSRQLVNHGVQPHSWHTEATFIEKYSGQSSSLGLANLYRTSTSAQTFPGVLNVSSVGPTIRNSASDLYQFADSVMENDQYRVNISHSAGAVSNVIPAPSHRSYPH